MEKIDSLAEFQNDGVNDGVRVRGFFRLNVVDPDGTVAGDSGWVENQVTNLGVQCFLIDNLVGTAGSSAISYVALGTGTIPAASGTALNGELAYGGSNSTGPGRTTFTYASANSTGCTLTFTFASGTAFVNSNVGTTLNIANIGLFASSSGGTLFAGKTYAASQLQSNQAVQGTYTVTISNSAA